ncbi:hypothetical protein PSm6_00080 [Pseudomonas solani]|uniref:Uncharacterized protein n=1 Tax=Pseudomonas solani TaxID=2731552 RepID=A0ABM7L256_9PSED|nr:hypothetical protein [Pseudomonas solani]BCD83601.1 hypothetical protein PSm6_00080 [Pseudomonas solani]
MNYFIHRMLGHHLMDAATEGGDAGGQQEQATEQQGSVLGQGAPQDFIPEKYRVTKDDGSLDLEQSSRKLAESYKHLETRMGSGDAPPKSFDEYAPKIEAEGFNWDEFKADEGSQSFLKGAHAKGLTNAQVEFVLGEYLKAAPSYWPAMRRSPPRRQRPSSVRPGSPTRSSPAMSRRRTAACTGSPIRLAWALLLHSKPSSATTLTSSPSWLTSAARCARTSRRARAPRSKARTSP